MKVVEVAGLEAARLRLIEVAERRDAVGLQREYLALEASNPRRLAESAATVEARTSARSWIEAWDAVLHEWVLATGESQELWRDLILLDSSGGFARRHWGLMAFWLAEVDSPRLGMSPLPEDLGALSLSDQARALGRFCTRHDGRTTIDYAAVHDALHPELRPFLAHWALSVYLISPTAGVASGVRENRRAVCADFARCHAESAPRLGVDALYFQAAYRAIYHSPDPHAFLSVLSERILAPRLAPGVARAEQSVLEARRQRDARQQRAKRSGKRKPSKSSGGGATKRQGGIGVVLSCFGEHHAVRRCTEPLLANLRDEGRLRGYYPGGDRSAALDELGTAWAGVNAKLVAMDASRLPDAQALAGRIAADRLDFLFLPEVGISLCSSVLATQRLARVQASTYGHPSTSGSTAMDYFIGGLDSEDGGTTYRERLVLLPGLGTVSNLPPSPLEGRRRPLSGDSCVFSSLSSIDKLNDELLTTWRGVLEAAGPSAELQHFPGARGGAATAIERAVHGRLGRNASYQLQPAMPRGVLLQRLQETDVLLDSFPFSGFNTLIDALSLSIPVVTLRRPGFAGVIGSAVMTKLGCARECVAESPIEYIAKAARLARDADLRLELRERLSRERVLPILCDTEFGAHFEAAVEWMRDAGPHHPGPPVYIAAGEPPRVLTGWPRR